MADVDKLEKYEDVCKRIKKSFDETEDAKRALVFVRHIERHLEEGRGGKVVCKICGKTIDEIYEER